ncbi:MAG: ParA family protein, partial [Spirochaetia bacterium]
KAKKLASGGKKIRDRIKDTNYEGLHILPSHLSYRDLALELNEKKKSGSRIKTSLKQAAKGYDLLIIDSPASLDLEAENIFRMADIILIPLIPTTLSLNSYTLIREFLEKQELDSVKIRLFFALADLRKKMHRSIIEEIKPSSPEFFHTVIPYSSAVEKMGLYREPFLTHSRKTKAALAYEDLWTEIREEAGLITAPIPRNP